MMQSLFEQLNVYGWKPEDENICFASVLTGDPLLLIGNPGSAKSYLAQKMAKSLGLKFVAYDASKAMFEDVIGFADISALKEGKTTYVPSEITIWDKEFVLLDEVNRAVLELQSKWLEIIRARKIMGKQTSVQWIWGAMNPFSSVNEGTNVLIDAMIGRFAAFVFAPDFLDIEEDSAKIRIARHINGDNAPALTRWGVSVAEEKDEQHVVDYAVLIRTAARFFEELAKENTSLGNFLAKFAKLLFSLHGIRLDGRRVGFLYRLILANRAIEMTRHAMFQEKLTSFKESAVNALFSGIPVEIEGARNASEVRNKIVSVVEIVKDCFEERGNMSLIERILTILTCSDYFAVSKELLTKDAPFTEIVKSMAWRRFKNHPDFSILSTMALQVEARNPRSIPPEIIDIMLDTFKDSEINKQLEFNTDSDMLLALNEFDSISPETNAQAIVKALYFAKLLKDKNMSYESIAETKTKLVSAFKIMEECA